MQAMWAQFGRGQRDYAPIKPYTMQDLESTLASVTSKEFAARMFNEHIRGKKPMPYEELLAKAGLLLRQSRLGTASLQHNGFSFSEAGTVLSSGTARGTPLYQSGLDRGDRILSIDGKVFKTQQN
jgi:predicted metalloprotease with PDZ domain